jgi:gamma-glutamyltranspeptidase/glutathione hydrolase
MNRRNFVQVAVTASAGAAASARSETATTDPQGGRMGGAGEAHGEGLPRVGPKPVARGKKAVASSQHPIVTETMLEVMREGGTAVDAAVAGCLVQATIQQEMTNHTGTVDFIFWDAKTGRAHELNSSGTLVSGLPPFRPLPPNLGVLIPATPPCACIPGFMPGLKAIHERFGTKPWARLVEPAVRWAEEGHPVSSFEFGVLTEELRGNVYFPAGRDLFTPGGFLPQVGDRFRKPELAKTLRRLAQAGPDDFITGEWARQFVAEANRLGWPLELKHLGAVPPRWGEPLRFTHRGHEILQLAPPERQGVFCALVLGVLRHLDLPSLGHYTQSAESLYYFAHALRWAEFECGFLQDPKMFEVPTDLWLSDSHHRHVAELLKRTRPKVDLTEHVKLTSGRPAMVAAGLPTGGPEKPPTYRGSCELSIVDEQGNWVQMMNTLQSGGIPGAVVGGVPMVGSHAQTDLRASIAGWFTGNGRLRLPIGNTLVLKDGKPWWSLGTPGNVHVTIPQVLSNVLDFGMSPDEAAQAPRLLALRDDYTLEVESRLPPKVVAGLARLGLTVSPLPEWDYHMGSFHMSWRDPATGLLNASADARRAGQADGY